jgi:hypothetical protein
MRLVDLAKLRQRLRELLRNLAAGAAVVAAGGSAEEAAKAASCGSCRIGSE